MCNYSFNKFDLKIIFKHDSLITETIRDRQQTL